MKKGKQIKTHTNTHTHTHIEYKIIITINLFIFTCSYTGIPTDPPTHRQIHIRENIETHRNKHIENHKNTGHSYKKGDKKYGHKLRHIHS